MADGTEPAGFVGRDEELARLRAARAATIHSRVARTVVVGGEAGIGKTSLIERFLAEAGRDGSRLLAGACLPSGRHGLAYGAFVGGLRDLARSVEPERLPALLGPGRVELARLLPELGPRVERAQGGGLEFDRSGSTRLYEAVLDVVDRLGRSGSAIVWIDDLQWADDGTRALLAFLVRNLRTSPVLFILAVRSDGIDRRDPVLGFLAELERDTGVERLELLPLSRRAFGDLLEERLGATPAAAVVDDLFERTAGNPFFAEQLVAATGGEPTGAAALPPGLRDVLIARLASLPDATQEVLRVAAASERRVDDDLLAAVMARPHDEIADAIRDAVSTGILVEIEASDEGHGAYAFRHALLQEVAYGELVRGERDRLHAAYAQELERRMRIDDVPVPPSELAHHWVAARDATHAVPALVAAGLAAERVYAFPVARRQYELALEWWDRALPDGAGETPDRIGVMQRAAECAVLTGEYARAIEWGHAAIAELAATSAAGADPARAGGLHDRLRWYLWEAGHADAAEDALDAALRLIPERPATAARARAEAQAAGLRLLAGDVERAGALVKQALETARAAGADAESALALGIAGWVRAVTGDVEGGIATFREGLAIAERLGGVEGIALGHANLAALLDRVGRTEASLAAALDGYEVTRRLGVVRTYGGILLGHAAKALFDAGRWSEAIAVADEGLDLDPAGRAAVWLHVNHARVDTNQGRYEAATTHLRLARHAQEASGGTEPYAAALLAAAAELALWQGRIEDVRATVDVGRGRLREGRPLEPGLGWLAWFGLRAEADVAERARSRQDAAALATAEDRVAPIVQRLAQSSLDRGTSEDARRAAIAGLCRAELSRLRAEHDPSVWADVAAAWSTIGRPAPTAYARYREAEAILAARGSRALAADRLGEAYGITERLGAAPLEHEIGTLARHARIDLAGARSVTSTGSARGPADDLGLTARETEVIRLVAAGRSNQQIADALFITRKTASVHVSNLLGKLGAQNRVEAASIAHRLGLDR